MSFKYKFQNLLNYKKTLENFKKSEYGKALHIYHREEENLEEIKSKKDEIVNTKTNGESVNVGTLRMYNDYLNKICQDIDHQKIVVEKCKKTMEETQEKLVEAMKEKKMFEKLREKEYGEFMEEEKRQEAKVIDEIVTFRTKTQ